MVIALKIYVELPEEAGCPGQCGKLRRWLYGMGVAAVIALAVLLGGPWLFPGENSYEQFAQHLRAQGHRVAEAYTPIEGGDNWQLVDDQGSLLLPHQSLKAVVDHVIDWQR